MIAEFPTVSMVSLQEASLAVRRAIEGGDGVESLLTRKKALVARVGLELGGSVIVKLWNAGGMRGLLRRVTRTSNMHAEWRTLSRLHKAGVAVPKPLGYCRVRDGSYTNAIIMEDLGRCSAGLDHVKTLLREGREVEHEQFVSNLIQMTHLILEAEIIDPDHGLQNILVLASGEPVRIDFELARPLTRWRHRDFGGMIGRLLTTYVFAVQPDVARMHEFAQRIKSSLNLPPRILKWATEYVQEQMAKQLALTGIDTRVRLIW